MKIRNVILGLIATLGVCLGDAQILTEYRITSTDLDKLVLQIKIGVGMWITLYSYFVIGILSAVCFLKAIIGKR